MTYIQGLWLYYTISVGGQVRNITRYLFWSRLLTLNEQQPSRIDRSSSFFNGTKVCERMSWEQSKIFVLYGPQILMIKSRYFKNRWQIQSDLLENSNLGREFYSLCTFKTFVGSSPTQGTYFFSLIGISQCLICNIESI